MGETGPGGGIVFYVHSDDDDNLFTSTGSDCETTCKYLEAALTDQSTGIAWCSTDSALGTTATAIGTGMANTTTADGTCTSGAIQIAADYTNNGKTDWHLPSIDELNQLYIERVEVGGFSGSVYWSSTEVGGINVSCKRFSNGNPSSRGKNGLILVRPVRPVRAFG